jgi:hypothetical protein
MQATINDTLRHAALHSRTRKQKGLTQCFIGSEAAGIECRKSAEASQSLSHSPQDFVRTLRIIG